VWQQRFRRSGSWTALTYDLSKYNQSWNTVSVSSEDVGSLPTNHREKISETLNAWNNELEEIDSLVGGG
jgi:hypothetical protein